MTCNRWILHIRTGPTRSKFGPVHVLHGGVVHRSRYTRSYFNTLERQYDSWIYNYLCNRCLSPLMLRVPNPLRARCSTLCDKVCQWLAAGRCFFPGPPVSSTNKTDRHDIAVSAVKHHKIKPMHCDLQFRRSFSAITIFKLLAKINVSQILNYYWYIIAFANELFHRSN